MKKYINIIMPAVVLLLLIDILVLSKSRMIENIYLILAAVVVLLLPILIIVIYKYGWYSKLRIRNHNKKTIEKTDWPLAMEVFSKQFMGDCYLTSVSWNDVPLKIKNSPKSDICPCPSCGKTPEDLVWFIFRSPNWTWRNLCGREGYMSICPCCKKVVGSILTAMN